MAAFWCSVMAGSDCSQYARLPAESPIREIRIQMQQQLTRANETIRRIRRPLRIEGEKCPLDVRICQPKHCVGRHRIALIRRAHDPPPCRDAGWVVRFPRIGVPWVGYRDPSRCLSSRWRGRGACLHRGFSPMNDALSDLIEARFGEDVEVPAELERNPELTGMAAHRSHRAFTSDPVPPPVLRALLASAFSAPAKSDLQQSSVVVVDDRHVQGQISGLIPSMPWIADAPVLLVFCGRQPPDQAHLRIARHHVRQRSPRQLPECGGRRGAGHGGIHPRRAGRGAGVLSR